jgi:hypothetical protein
MVSLLAITAAKDVIDGHFIFDSALWWHELILPSFNLCVNRELDETMGDPFDQPVHHLHQVQQIQRQRTTQMGQN